LLIFAYFCYAIYASLQRNIIAFHSPERAYFVGGTNPALGAGLLGKI
jgi:hypothetical protein